MRTSMTLILENRTFFVHAHNCDSGVMLVRVTLIGYGTVIISFMKRERVVTQERFETTIGKHSRSRSRFKN